jgi:hypothetical protein
VADFLQMASFWGEYPLTVELVAIARRFQVGPFWGEAKAASVCLHLFGSKIGEPVSLPKGGSISVSLGSVTYQLQRTEAPARIRRFRLPEMRMVLATLLSLVLAAVTLEGAAMSIPDLKELADSDPRQDIDYPFPASSSVRLPRWATAVGRNPSLFHWTFEGATGIPSDLPDCRKGTLPPCPRDVRAYTVEQVLLAAVSGVEEHSILDEESVIVDGRLGAAEIGVLSLFPVRLRRRIADDRFLYLQSFEYMECGRQASGQRVLVEGMPLENGLYFRRMCAVVPGVEPSRR